MNPIRPLLLVEDDPDVSASLRFWLGTEGYSVETFGSVESLMQAGFSKAEVLIIDEHLPDGSGSELVRKIHAGGVPILANGECIGGVGVSGGDWETDLKIAQAAVESIGASWK